MRPDLQFSILCDDVRREDNGKFIFIGLFEMMNLPQFPAIYARLNVVNRWGAGQGIYRQQVRIVSPLNQVVAQAPETEILLADTDGTVTTHNVFLNVPFDAPGRYFVEVLLDGDLVRRYLVSIKQGPPVPLS